MSSERKLLKVICLLYVLDALACLAFGGIVLAGMGLIDPAATVDVGGTAFALQPWALGFGVWGIAAGIYYLVFAMAGIKGANNPRKIGPFRAMAVVALVVALVGLPLSVIFSDGAVISVYGSGVLVSLLFSVACIALSGKVARQAER